MFNFTAFNKINWGNVVDEAKKRRRGLKMTQYKLALMAEVSTPTLQRFERGDKNLKVSSVLKIISCLGMVDERDLTLLNLQQKKVDKIKEDLECLKSSCRHEEDELISLATKNKKQDKS